MTAEQHTELLRASAWIEGLTYEDLPGDVVSLATSQILDTLAAICAGSRSGTGRAVVQAMESISVDGPCTVIPGGKSWPLLETVYRHAVLANALELDSLVFIGHVAQSSVSIPLALGEMNGIDGKSAIVAQVAAVEVAGRLGAYLASGPHHGHMRSYLHRVAGAVAAAKILGLNQEKIQNALAIALAMSEYVLYPGAFSPDTKVLCSGSPSVEGVRAALLSQRGLDGATDILEHPAGFYSVFSYLPEIRGVWDQLGKTWCLQAFSSKQYAACAYAQGPVAAAHSLRERTELDAADIRHVQVFAPLTTVSLESMSRPHKGAGLTPVNLNFSTRKSVAATLLFGELTGESFVPRIFEERRAAIQTLAERVVLIHDWKLTIELGRGVDAAIHGAGKPGVLGMSQTGKSLKNLKKKMGSRPLFSWSDLPDMARLAPEDRRYLARRYWRGFRSQLPFLRRQSHDNFRSFESDLTRYELRQAGLVRVRMKDGQVAEEFCRLPPGFSGDPRREEAVERKFDREAGPVWGEAGSNSVKKAVRMLPDSSVRHMMAIIRNVATSQA